MLLNNDTEADPGLFERLLLALEQEPGAGAVGAAHLLRGAHRAASGTPAATLAPALGYAAHRGLRTLDQGQYRVVEATGYLTGCCLLATREVWERVGLLDERYFIYAEDADWCAARARGGLRLLFVPTARLWHKVSALERRRRARGRSTSACAPTCTLFATHARGLARFTWLPAFLAQQAVLAAWLLARGQGGAAAAVPTRAVGRAARPARRRGDAGERDAVGGEAGARSRRPAAVPARDDRRGARARRWCSTPGCGPGSWNYDRRSGPPDHAASTSSSRPGHRRRAPGVAVLRADLARLPLRAELFDLTVCHYVLEHVTELEACCDELVRVTQAGRHALPLGAARGGVRRPPLPLRRLLREVRAAASSASASSTSSASTCRALLDLFYARGCVLESAMRTCRPASRG